MLWLPNKEANEIFDIEVADLETLSSIVVPWAKETVKAAIEKNETESANAVVEKEEDEEAKSVSVSSDDERSMTFSEAMRGDEPASVASPVLDDDFAAVESSVAPQPAPWNGTDTSYCYTCNKWGHVDKYCYVLDFADDQALQGTQDTASNDGSIIVNAWHTPAVKESNFCQHCKIWGHKDEFCKELFPEENLNFCRVCDMDGHTEDTCWRLHPHLKAEYDVDRKKLKEKMLCTGCGKIGHLRRWCWRLHPELKPQPRV